MHNGRKLALTDLPSAPSNAAAADAKLRLPSTHIRKTDVCISPNSGRPIRLTQLRPAVTALQSRKCAPLSTHYATDVGRSPEHFRYWLPPFTRE